MFTQFLLNGLVTGSMYALGSVGFALIYNTTRIFHIAYAALFVIAGYIGYVVSSMAGIPYFVSVLAAMLGVAMLSILIDKVVYQPLERLKSTGNVIMISSIGVMIVFVNLLAMIFGNEVKIFSSQISASVEFNGLILTYNQLMQLVTCSCVLAAFLLTLKYTSLGLRTRAIRDDTQLLAVLGINAFPTRRFLFGFSGSLVALISCLIAFDVGLDPYTGMPFLLNVIVALIIGGVGNFIAPIIGGFLLAFVQAVTVYFFEAKWESAVTFLVLVIFLLVRPQGLLGERTRAV